MESVVDFGATMVRFTLKPGTRLRYMFYTAEPELKQCSTGESGRWNSRIGKAIQVSDANDTESYTRSRVSGRLELRTFVWGCMHSDSASDDGGDSCESVCKFERSGTLGIGDDVAKVAPVSFGVFRKAVWQGVVAQVGKMSTCTDARAIAQVSEGMNMEAVRACRNAGQTCGNVDHAYMITCTTASRIVRKLGGERDIPVDSVSKRRLNYTDETRLIHAGSLPLPEFGPRHGFRLHQHEHSESEESTASEFGQRHG